MSLPAVILLCLWSVGLSVHLFNDGKPTPVQRYQFWPQFLARAVWVVLLYWGGFFSHGQA